MSPADAAQLGALREEIEAVDEALILALARRMELAREIRVVKQRAGQPVLDPAREAAVVSRASTRARAAGLPEDEVRALYWKIMALARRVQVS
jgi:chorismate mutase